MKKIQAMLVITLFLFGFLIAKPVLLMAAEHGGTTIEGSHMEGSHAKVAIDGHCPVCIIGGKVVDGNKNFATEYKGKVYNFVRFEQQKMFINDPEKYIANLEKKYQDLKTKSEGSHKAEGSHMMEEGSH